MSEWMKTGFQAMLLTSALAALALFLARAEMQRAEEQLNYKYHLVCGDTDYGVVYRLQEKHDLFKFERPYEENKHYTVSAIGCTYVKVGD